MKLLSRNASLAARGQPLVVRLAVLCLTGAAIIMLAAAPAAADHKHKHKHGHGHGHHHHNHHYDNDYGYYDYDHDDDVIVIVQPRPRYVRPPAVHYYPAPVYGGPLFNVVIPVEID